MKKTITRLGLVVFILLLAFSTYLRANNQSNARLDKEKILIQMVMNTLEQAHYNPVKIDDHFSAETFDLYLKDLDPAKKFFCKTDIETLTRYQKKVDDELNSGTTHFLTAANAVLRIRVDEVQSFYTKLLSRPFDFNMDETIRIDPEKRDYCKNSADLKQFWSKLLKYQTLIAYLQMVQDNKDLKKQKEFSARIDPKIEAQARKKVALDIKRVLNRILQETRQDQVERYLNDVAAVFDPHSNYYAPEATEQFNIDMSGTLEGIGASLIEQDDGDYIRVASIIPGSPAWRQKGLKEGDLILKVAEGDREPVDVANMRINDVVKLIRGKKGTTVKLTVKKPDGQIKAISLVRDVVVIEDSYAKSAVIQDSKSGKSFGYISLPSFYHDFNSQQARNSADDVRKSLQQLNRQKLSGIVLDLRGNGGGALDDAVKMTGLFIKDGPVVQVREQNNKVQVLRDTDSDIVYQGPLVVLINSLSASASEILAAALQDYDRAIIIGSNSFGKGTVQSMVDMDRMVSNDYQFLRPLGSLKVTIQKFYRINGGSTQFKGVAPDIALPDALINYKIGEKELPHSLPYDEVKPASYQTWKETADLAALKAKSAERVKHDNVFKLIKSSMAQLKLANNQIDQSLRLKKTVAEQEQLKKQNEKLEQAEVVKKYLTVRELDNTTASQDWRKQLGKDEYIEEALNVLADMK